MERFMALEFKPHPNAPGVRAVMQFENGYRASVIRTAYSYGGDRGLYELAVMDSEGLVYDTPITNDVEGYLSEADVDRLLGEIRDLPSTNTEAG